MGEIKKNHNSTFSRFKQEKILTVHSRFYETKCCKRLQLREKKREVCCVCVHFWFLSLVFVGFYVCRLLLSGKCDSKLSCLPIFYVKTWKIGICSDSELFFASLIRKLKLNRYYTTKTIESPSIRLRPPTVHFHIPKSHK